jgi:hypothetical protein
VRPESHDGFRGKCISCDQVTQAKWNDENLDRKNEWDRQYYASNAEQINREFREKYAADPAPIRARNKKWRDENPESMTAQARRNREKHGEKIRADRRRHYQENKARYKAQAVARQTHIKQATPPWADMEKITAFYVEAERLTKETGIPHHVDHFYPLRGKMMCGFHVEGNLQIIHAVANLRKSNRVDEGRTPEALFPSGENSV